MRLSEVQDLFYNLISEYWVGAEITYARQDRIAKPKNPLVLLTYGNVTRYDMPNYMIVDGVNVAQYQCSVLLDIDLFTHGAPMRLQGMGEVLTYRDSAVEDMSAFEDFLNSEYCVEFCDIHSISWAREGDIQNLSGIINETSYEYRSRITLRLYYVSLAVEHAGVLSEDSILYPTGRFVDGKEVFAPGAPVRKTSTTGHYGSPEEEQEKRAIVVPPECFIPTPSGGGSKVLAKMQTGYYEDVDIICEFESTPRPEPVWAPPKVGIAIVGTSKLPRTESPAIVDEAIADITSLSS